MQEPARGATGREGAPGREGERGIPGVVTTEIGPPGPPGPPGRRGRSLAPRSVAAFALVTILFFATLGLLSYYITQNRDLAEQGAESHKALCIFKARKKSDLRRSNQFLQDHPNGAPPITAAIIRQSIEDQSKDLVALRVLNCK